MIRSYRELLFFCLYNKSIATFIIAKNNFRIHRFNVIEFNFPGFIEETTDPQKFMFHLRFPRTVFKSTHR